MKKLAGSFAAICVLLVTGTSLTAEARNSALSNHSDSTFASGPSDGGRLIIKRSPVLAYDISITFKIDGRVAGTSVRARNFDEYITPGRHVLVATPNGLRGDWRGIVDVRPGQTSVYIIKYNGYRLFLERITKTRYRSY